MGLAGMNVNHVGNLRKGLTFAGVAFLGQLGVFLMGQLAGPRFGSAWYSVQGLIYAGLAVALVCAAWQLSKAVEATEFPMIMFGLSGLILVLDLFWFIQELARFGDDSRTLVTVLGIVGTLAGAALTLSWCLVLSQVAGTKLGWATPAAIVVAVLTMVRTLMTIASFAGFFGLQGMYWVRTPMSVVIPLVLGTLALMARGVELGAPSPSLTGIAAMGAPAIVPEPGGARLILTGVVLMMIGAAVTAASYGAASGGGRYVVATGAIASGAVTFFRGLIRLGARS
jgi:hypothetical protein